MKRFSLEVKYKRKLFYYIQIVKLILASFVFLTSVFIIKEDIYNFFVPYTTMGIISSSFIGLVLCQKIDKSLKYSTFLVSGIEFGVMIWSIYICKFAYPSLFFWVPVFILFTYFFTNKVFTAVQGLLFILFISLWPRAFYEDSEIIWSTVNGNYTPSFYLTTIGFTIFLFAVFFFSEKIKHMYAQAITEASTQIEGEQSFPVNNPNPTFEYNKIENLVPKNHHAREFVLTATNIEIDRLMQYSLDTMNSGQKRKVRCMLGRDHYIVNLVPVNNKVNVYMTNITDLIRAQIEIEQKEQYNRAVIDAMPGFVSWIDSDLNYLGVNNHLCEFFNANESEFIGNKVGSVHTHNDTSVLTLATKLFENSFVDSLSDEIKYEYDGEEFWNYITLKKYNHGKNAVLVSVDITNLKQAENQIIQEQKKAEASAKLAAFGEMSAGIAHEINNPLAIIKGTVQRINKLRSKGTLTEEKYEELLEKCHYGIDRVTKIISGMKNLSRDGQYDAIETAPVKEIIEDSLVLLSKKCEVNNIELFISNYDDSIQLDCQRVQISQVLVILINNSIDAIKDDEKKWIKININANEDFLNISIVDSGKGIQAQVAQKIFKPFFTTKKVGKGTGLGLSLAARIIKAHKGEFSLDPDYLNTKFDLQIPLKHT